MVPISLKKMFSFAKIRPMNFLRFIFSKSLLRQIVLSIVACIVFSFLALKWLKSYTNHGAFVEVPNLVGLSLDDAKTTLQNFDLRTQVQDEGECNFGSAGGEGCYMFVCNNCNHKSNLPLMGNCWSTLTRRWTRTQKGSGRSRSLHPFAPVSLALGWLNFAGYCWSCCWIVELLNFCNYFISKFINKT